MLKTIKSLTHSTRWSVVGENSYLGGDQVGYLQYVCPIEDRLKTFSSVTLKGNGATHRESLDSLRKTQLELLVEEAQSLGLVPTNEEALASGTLKECGHNTTADGYVYSYEGSSIVELPTGTWKCVGHKMTGDAYYAYDGHIEFILL
jgi:hypothetical protein